VPSAFVIVPLLLVFSQPGPRVLIAGAAIALAGIAIRAWASGHLNKMTELTTSGPYAYTRNPLYLGTLLLVVGVAVASGTWWLALASGAVFLALYVPVMLAEIDTMRERFPREYDTYAANVPLFFPRLVPFRDEAGRAGKGFDTSLYMKYREYRAAIGLFAIFAFLIGMMYYKGHVGL